MDFNVAHQVLLVAKAGSASVAFVCFHLWRVNTRFVPFQGVELCKIRRALVAFIGLLTSMNALTRFQLANSSERMLASLARERLLARVDHPVSLERAHYREWLFADAARIAFLA